MKFFFFSKLLQSRLSAVFLFQLISFLNLPVGYVKMKHVPKVMFDKIVILVVTLIMHYAR